MRIRAGFQITFETDPLTPLILLTSVHPSRRGDLETRDALLSSPRVPARHFLDPFANIATRLLVPGGRLTLTSSFIVRDGGEPEPHDWDAVQHPVHDLPDETLPFSLAAATAKPIA